MKKAIIISVAVMAMLTLFAACGAPEVKYVDGIHRAEADSFANGWKYFVVAQVSDGDVVDVTWDAMPEEGGVTKYVLSENGEYGMMDNSDAQWPWFEQANAVTGYFMENPSLQKPDAISGATIGIDGFYNLMSNALTVAEQ